MGSIGLVAVKSADELIKEEEAKLSKEKALKAMPVIDELASYVRRCWSAADRNKSPVEERMEQALRQREGKYAQDKLAEITRHGGSTIYMKLSDEKSNAAKSWVYDILFQATEKPYCFKHTPIPELNPEEMATLKQAAFQEVLQQAQMGIPPDSMKVATKAAEQDVRKRANKLARNFVEKIEKHVDDLTVEGGWQKALKETISDVIDFPVGILKGPVIRRKNKLAWAETSSGDFVPKVQEHFVIEFERVSPFDIYPSPLSTEIDDGYLIERHRLNRSGLHSFLKVDGYIDKNIKKVLAEYDEGGISGWLTEERHSSFYGESPEQEKDEISVRDPEEKIDALQFWGTVSGKKLKDYGLNIKDESDEYHVELWLIGDHIIKASFNADPLGRKPYYKASFRERNGSFWGESLLDIISDIQDMCNATARHLVNNMALASGPQVGVDVGRLAEGEDPTSMYPWTVWQFDEETSNISGGRPPLWFFQPNPMISELMSAYQFFSTEADNKTGVPKYAYGSGGSGSALGTATGMSMMMGNASKGIKQVVGNIDEIITKSISRIYDWLMIYGDDPSIKGDVSIVAKGSSALLAKEQQQVRRNEFLNIALNPTVSEIIGRKGIAEIVRKIGQGLELDVAEMIPTAEEIELQEESAKRQQMMMMQAEQAAQQSAPPPNARAIQPGGAVQGGNDVAAFQQSRT